MLIVGQLQQLTPDQRAISQIERRLGLNVSEFADTVGMQGGVDLAQVMAGQGKANVSRIDVLAGMAFNQHKTGTQTFMAGNQAVE
ncbi:hypothetical protein Xbed_03582 [Xenorhabdus beddingii]|uniref:Uncharacterized protein n=1 Tax=Xenorhabdus beddingii TaxID=40578 RepID=A0A1Y2SA19_9GAMM|nr:hypothetical protein Xbed_03582 [Xenorhabdus beddingii]